MKICELTESMDDYLEALDNDIELYYKKDGLAPWSAFSEAEAYAFCRAHANSHCDDPYNSRDCYYDEDSIYDRLELHKVIIDNDDDRMMHNRRASRRHKINKAMTAARLVR